MINIELERMGLFQSTLPVAGERCAGVGQQASSLARFNPRSPLPGSDAILAALEADQANVFQSTLPVAGERCLERETAGCRETCFNPRSPLPGSDAGRCWPPKCRTICFNPRSPLPGSDARNPPATRSLSTLFQSTLPVAGERCCIIWVCFRRCAKFQSTLPVAGERCGDCRFVGDFFGRFNPRSPLPGSDAVIVGLSVISLVVSIHAPRCRGAMPLIDSHTAAESAVSIHAPRCRGAMHRRRFRRCVIATFQSTLPVAGERCLSPSLHIVGHARFNPRSPLPGSDAFGAGGCEVSGIRFNPRSPLPGSDANITAITTHAARRFNPRSPLPGSDARWCRVSTCGSNSFNPRSPLPGSDATTTLRSCGCRAVSIHAPRCRGAMRRIRAPERAFPAVSIHAPRCRGAMPKAMWDFDRAWQFQSTLPVAGERCSSSITFGSKSTKLPHCANVLAQERGRSYMRRQCTKKLN